MSDDAAEHSQLDIADCHHKRLWQDPFRAKQHIGVWLCRCLEIHRADSHTDAGQIRAIRVVRPWARRMDVAIDKVGKRVSATKASRYADYVCPECRIRVTLVRGEVQVWHFRHAARTEMESKRAERCSLYVADQGGSGRGGYHSAILPPPPPKPRLAVRWISKGQGNLWGLVVSIPRPAVEVDYVQVDGNVNGAASIRRESIISRLPVWVKAANRKYEVRAYSRARQLLTSAAPAGETETLDHRRVNLFHAGVDGGLQLAPEEPAIRGKAYFALARRAVWSPPSPRLIKLIERVDFCDPKREWLGHLVYFPLTADAEVTDWVERHCQRTLEDRLPSIDLAAPPASTSCDATNLISSAEDVLIIVRGDKWDTPHIEVVNEETGEAKEKAFESVEDRTTFCISGLPVGESTVHFRDWDLVSLHFSREPCRIAEIAEVTLVTAANSDGKEIASPLHSSEAESRWNALFSGAETWRRISIPNGLALTLSWRADGLHEQINDALTSPEKFAEELAVCLSARPTFARLDGGAFGRIEWHRPRAPQHEKPAERRLPRALIHKVQWLLLGPEEGQPSAMSPLGTTVALDRISSLCDNDKELVSRFLGVSDWPTSRVAHARAAVGELLRSL